MTVFCSRPFSTRRVHSHTFLHTTWNTVFSKYLMESPSLHALVLYKTRPARVKHVGTERLQIDLENTSRSVRPKDVVPIHPGPISQEELCSLNSTPVSP